MKNITLLIMAFFITRSANAQFSFGGEAGLNFFNATQKIQPIDNPSIIENNKGSFRRSGKIGGLINYQLRPRLDLRTGIYYSMKGFRNLTLNRNGFDEYFKWNANINYLEIPLNVFLRFGKAKKSYFGPGAYVGYGIGGKVKITTYEWGGFEGQDERRIKFGEVSREELNDFRPLDYGIQFSAGYRLAHNLFIQAQYSQGLANTLPLLAGGTNTDIYKNWGMTISAGWSMETGRKQTTSKVEKDLP